jgi:hypothetical protein
MLTYFPRIEELETIVHTAGDKSITTLDNIEFIVKMKSNRRSSFCNAVRYPFLKMEGWWLMVLERNVVVHLEHFSFLKEDKYETKFYRGYREPGNYGLMLKVFSDCYYGFDVERVVKFVVGEEKKVKEMVETEEKENLDEDESFFGKIMKMVTLPEEEELSDTEADAAKKKPETGKSETTK